MSKVLAFIDCHEGNQQEVMYYFHHLLTSFPTVRASIKYQIPFYEQGLLESKGRKQVLSVDFESIAEIPEKTIREVINEALFLNENVPYKPKGKRIQE